jgi:Lar family restriction alleviation protein
MTNGEKFKTVDERYDEFKKFCKKRITCEHCPCNAKIHGAVPKCLLEWLDLEYKEELKPCPFCGDESVNVFKSIDRDIWYASCNKCGVRTEGDTSEELAIDKWNRRV